LDKSIAGWRPRTGLRAGTDYAGTEERIRADAVLAPEDLWLVGARRFWRASASTSIP
jgi:hypothetical protein